MSEQMPLPAETEDVYRELGAEATTPEELQALAEMATADRAARAEAIENMAKGTLPELTISANGVVAATEEEVKSLQEEQEYGQGGPRA